MAGRVLYWGSGSIPCWKAMIVLAEKGINYESKLISFDKDEQRGPDIRALNPRGQIPVFKDGDRVICESVGICLYLESVYPNQGTQLLPSDPEGKARVFQKLMEANENLMRKAIEDVPYYILYEDESKKSEAQLKENLKNCMEEWSAWEKYLKESGYSYIAGNDFTLADAIFFPFLAWAWRMSIDFEKFPCLKKYFELLQQRPSIQASWPPHWREGDSQPEKMAFLKNL